MGTGMRLVTKSKTEYHSYWVFTASMVSQGHGRLPQDSGIDSTRVSERSNQVRDLIH